MKKKCLLKDAFSLSKRDLLLSEKVFLKPLPRRERFINLKMLTAVFQGK